MKYRLMIDFATEEEAKIHADGLAQVVSEPIYIVPVEEEKEETP